VKRGGVVLLAALAAAGCTRVVDAVTAMGCASQSPGGAPCVPISWPTAEHAANSDPWLVAHHDTLVRMAPRVLVLNFDNGATSDQALQTANLQAAAIAEGSRPHAYADDGAQQSLQYDVVKVVDLTDHPPPAGWNNPSSTLLPTTAGGAFDPTALFTSQFAAAYGWKDASSKPLTLCQLFQRGAINEVWIQDGEAGIRRAPLNVESKQVYDAAGNAIVGLFLPCAGGGGCLDQTIACGVTVRMAHLDPARGPGCDLQVRGWGIEGMWDALPAYAADARAFLNADFDARFGVQFRSFADICDQSGDACVSYPNDHQATGAYADGTPWTIQPFLQGCGSSRFPPNARARGDFLNGEQVQSRCQGFGLAGGAGGGDLYQPYSAATVAGEDSAFPDCGGGWQIYWRQSMPGPGNAAHLKSWWPFLFY
jgi:hypothetical protein